MALQKSYNFKGIDITDAYHAVTSVKYYKDLGEVKFTLETYGSKAARDEDIGNSIGTYFINFTPTGSYDVVGSQDIATSCYTYLKTLDQWSGSVDV